MGINIVGSKSFKTYEWVKCVRPYKEFVLGELTEL